MLEIINGRQPLAGTGRLARIRNDDVRENTHRVTPKRCGDAITRYFIAFARSTRDRRSAVIP